MKLFFSLIPFPIFLFSFHCFSQQPSSTFELNNYLATMLDSVYVKGVAWGVEMENADETGSYDKLKTLRMGLETTLDKDIIDVRQLNDIGGSEDFRKAMLNFFLFEEKLVSTTFRPFENLNSSSKDEEKTKLEKALDDGADKEELELDKVRKVQLNYAAKNGFTITPDGDKIKTQDNTLKILDHN